MRVKNFKHFESSKFISEDDIRDVFMELLDKDFNIEFFDTASNSSFYFDVKKIFSEEYFDPIDMGSAFGITNLSKMNEEVKFTTSIIEEVKERINSMNYEIGFEFEFHFSLTPMIYIGCHMQHRDYIPRG